MTIFKLVGGTDVKPAAAAERHRNSDIGRLVIRIPNPDDPGTLSTAENGRLRESRKEIWRMAEAATRYWRVRLDFDSAVSLAQNMEIPEGRYHPVVDHKDRYPIVDRWREALVKQLLTPAPDTRSVAWKQTILAGRQSRHLGVKLERIERAIAEDLAFLAAHPIRRKGNAP
jgi:hypothetical protein